jgi:hypothetical protein
MKSCDIVAVQQSCSCKREWPLHLKRAPSAPFASLIFPKDVRRSRSCAWLFTEFSLWGERILHPAKKRFVKPKPASYLPEFEYGAPWVALFLLPIPPSPSGGTKPC